MVGLLPLPRVWLPGNKQLLKEGPVIPHERSCFLPLLATQEITLFIPALTIPQRQEPSQEWTPVIWLRSWSQTWAWPAERSRRIF